MSSSEAKSKSEFDPRGPRLSESKSRVDSCQLAPHPCCRLGNASLSKLFCGSTQRRGLPNDLGRYLNILCLQLFCTNCASQTQVHIVFECPAVQCVRYKFVRLVLPLDQVVQQFPFREKMHSLVHFQQACTNTLSSRC